MAVKHLNRKRISLVTLPGSGGDYVNCMEINVINRSIGSYLLFLVTLSLQGRS